MTPRAAPPTSRLEAPAYRDANVPVPELVRVLRDPAQPMEERLRVAEVLGEHASDEVRQLAEETADDAFASNLAARLPGSNGPRRS